MLEPGVVTKALNAVTAQVFAARRERLYALPFAETLRRSACWKRTASSSKARCADAIKDGKVRDQLLDATYRR